MIGDQSKETPEGRVLKENSEILPTSMQNPSDEDATYRKKGNKEHVGYVLNLEEGCSENGNLITGYDYKPNTYSDTQFAKDVLNALPDDNGVDVIITDGAYGSAELLEIAEEKNVKLAATTLIGGVQDSFETGFEINDDNMIVKCPAGHAPLSSAYDIKREVYKARYNTSQCKDCPYCERCPGTFEKRHALIKFTKTARVRAEYFTKMETEEYKQYARLRNGVEGIPSVLRRRYRMDHMPVRGLLRSKMWIGFKIGAINTVRLLKAMEIKQRTAEACITAG
jgi:hypothetical protein